MRRPESQRPSGVHMSISQPPPPVVQTPDVVEWYMEVLCQTHLTVSPTWIVVKGPPLWASMKDFETLAPTSTITVEDPDGVGVGVTWNPDVSASPGARAPASL